MLKALFLVAQLLALSACIAVPVDDGSYPQSGDRRSHHRHDQRDEDRRDRDGDGHDDPHDGDNHR